VSYPLFLLAMGLGAGLMVLGLKRIAGGANVM
jgi:magnesium transporter